MKTKYIFLAAALFCSTLCLAQGTLFETYANRDQVTTVHISKAMFQLMPDLDISNLKLKQLAEKITSLDILTTEDAATGTEINQAFTRTFSRGYTELMRVKDQQERIAFYTKQEGNLIHELLLLVEEPNKYTLIWLKGNFTLEDIQKIASSMK